MSKDRIKQLLQDRRLPGYIASGLFLLFLAGTVIVLQVHPPERQRRAFWFPDSTRTTMNAEFRFVPRRETTADQIFLYVGELALGPARMGSVPFLPRSVMLKSVVFDGQDRLYIDFSASLAVRLEEGESSLEDITDATTRNVRHNFPFLREIVYTIGGQLPNVPRFDIPALTKGQSAL